MGTSDVFAFETTIAGEGDGFPRIINARTAGKAKAERWRDLREVGDFPFTCLRVRKIGTAYTSPEFARNAHYRGMPAVRCGQRVKVEHCPGTIVGHNSSANFDVLFDDDAPQYAGLTLNVHPGSVELIDVKAAS